MDGDRVIDADYSAPSALMTPVFQVNSDDGVGTVRISAIRLFETP